ncbi:MAG TPA: carboxypeptidase-like regulatory domain-containing protein, partial [Gemmatirosa sp.]
MTHSFLRRRAPQIVAAVIAAALPLGVAAAQTSTGTVRGYVRNATGVPVGDVQVSAKNIETNQVRGATTSASGAYTLGGLRPGSYEVTARRIGLTPQTRRLLVQVGQTLDINFAVGEAATQLTAVQVTGSATAAVAERRTTEVATNVTQAQIANLPSPSRNFLDLAQLAPGTRISIDRINGTSKTFAAGAQGAEQVNVFVDGASYKNDIITGGVAGQDASRGNPFPRNAVQEFRIITNNFRAEYQKASSAIITAVTKSGTNTWQGNAFTELQNQSFVAL